jgi:hypothetical protein
MGYDTHDTGKGTRVVLLVAIGVTVLGILIVVANGDSGGHVARTLALALITVAVLVIFVSLARLWSALIGRRLGPWSACLCVGVAVAWVPFAGVLESVAVFDTEGRGWLFAATMFGALPLVAIGVMTAGGTYAWGSDPVDRRPARPDRVSP